jgi:ornithine decarboxylase
MQPITALSELQDQSLRASVDVDIPDHPTPFFHFELDRLVANLATLRAALPGFRIFYAVKCNSQPAILETLARRGTGFEIASGAELRALLELGVHADDILFSNPVKVPADIRLARASGLERYAVDSEEELAKIAEEAPGAAIYVRMQTTGAGSRFPLSKRFGAAEAEALELLLTARDMDLIPYGCTFHVGSQNTEVSSWEQPIAACARLMEDFERLTGARLQMLDIGGGWLAQYAGAPVPTIAEFGSSIQRALGALPYPVDLIAEPGRALVAEASILVTSIIGKRRQRDATWVHLDAGPYTGLMEAPGFLGGEPFPISWSGDKASAATTSCILTGPTCDDGDIVQDDVAVPTDLEVGDRVHIGVAGAYSSTLATSFNGFAPPTTNFVDEEIPALEERHTPLEERSRRPRQPDAKREIWGLAAIVTTALLWALSANVAEGLYASGVTGLQVAGAETVIAALCLAGLRLRRRIRTPKSTLETKRKVLLGVSLALMVTTYYVAIDKLSVAPAVVLHYTAPALVVAWTWLKTKRSPGPRTLLCLGLAVGGIALVTELTSGVGHLNPLGVSAALGSAAFLAAYTLISESAMTKVSALETTTSAFFFATPLALGAMIVGGWPRELFSPGNLWRVLFIGFFGALVGTGLYVWSIGMVRATKAAIAANLEPVIAAVVAWVWLGQSLSPLQMTGGALIFGAVVLLHEREATRPSQAIPPPIASLREPELDLLRGPREAAVSPSA